MWLWLWEYSYVSYLLYIINHFDIIIMIFRCFFFFTPLSSFLLPPLDSKPESLEAHKIKTAFFTHPTLTEIGRRLVSHYFLLTEEELAMWEEDPESFGNSTSSDTWAESKCLELSGHADWQIKNACSWEVQNSEHSQFCSR